MKRITLFSLIILASTIPAALAQEEANDEDEVYELSPFVVKSDNKGYLESNAVSGTSLNMKIRDLPMPLEVINNELINDLQATDLKEALAYSAGVFTKSYVDGSGANSGGSAERSPSTVASVNNPFTNTVSIRGFAVPNQQRFGFRIGGVAVGEGFSTVLGGLTDSINMERLEVVRGPASLLYGVNVLSGVVNIIPKRPLGEFRGNLALSAGSQGYRRGALDVTGPILKDRIHYRLMFANEERGSETMFREDSKEYYAAQVEFLLGSKFQLLIEGQYGKLHRTGTGAAFFTDSFTGIPIAENGPNSEHFRTPFYEQVKFGKEDYSYLVTRDDSDPLDIFLLPKSNYYADDENPLPVMGQNFRISGPDTYYDREEYNLMALLTMEPIKNLNLEFGAYFTHAEEESFNVNMSVFTNAERDLTFTPSDEAPFPAFFRTSPSRVNLWARQPEAYNLIGGYPTNLPLSTDKYGFNEAVGFSVVLDDIPNFSGGTDLSKVDSAGLGEIFIVPDRQRRSVSQGTDWNTWNTKFAQYFWTKTPTESDSLQLRGRAAYTFESGFPFVEGKSIKHTFIGGYQFTKDELRIISGKPAIEDVFTPGTLQKVDGVADLSLGSSGSDPYILRNVFDMTPIRYNGERIAVPGRITTSSVDMGLPLSAYVNDGILEDGEIDGWNIGRSGWRDVTVDQQGYYGIYQAQFFEDKATFYAGLRHDSYQVEEVELLRALDGIPSINPDRNTNLTDLYYGSSAIATLPFLLGDGSEPYTPDRWISDLPDALNLEIQHEMELLRAGIGEQGTRQQLFEETQSFTTGSAGFSVRIIDPLSVYLMYSEGVFPNQGQRDGLDRPIPAEQTTNKEIGIKFDLFDGKISGTMSVYKIERTNATWQFNSAPTPRRFVGGALSVGEVQAYEDQIFTSFDAKTAVTGNGPEALVAQDVYSVSTEDVQRYSYGIHESFFIDVVSRYLGEDVASGIKNSEDLEDIGLGFVKTTDQGVGGSFENKGLTEPYYWADVSEDFVAGKYVNADGVDLGLMVMEAFDNALGAKDFDGRSIFYTDSGRTGVMGAGNNPSNRTGDLVTFSDETVGFDGQIYLTPMDNYQIIFSFSYQNRQVVGKGFNLVPLVDPISGESIPGTKYDEWVFLLGEENFTDPTDPTTFTGEGVNGLDLSFVPKINLSVWNKYMFTEGPLEGLGVALGVRYFGEAPTSIPIGGTGLRANSFPTPPTEERYTLDASFSYSFKLFDLPWKLSLKINNLLNDTRIENRVEYENTFDNDGSEYRRSVTILPPRTYRLALSTRF